MKKLYIIIPVYKGLNQTRECIRSVLKYAPGYPLVIINDASPDPELNRYLNSLEPRDPLIHILDNPVNLGFVKTVNIGFQFDRQKDVIILNSDTVVTSNWVEKLQSWAYSDPKAATVTPMSNSATICSYPVSCKQNLLPDNLTPDQLNSYFEKAGLYNEDELIEIPTGVGFCLFMKREYLEKIGYFNETLFGTGYGEENDFCLRCVNQGARHLVATDTFIFHDEGTSFGSEQKQKQTANAIQVLNKLYPDYDAVIQHYIETDPLTITRRRVDLLRYFTDQKKSILFVSHGKGGGVDKHVHELSEIFVAKDWQPFVLTPLNNRGVVIQSGSPEEEFYLEIDSRNWLTTLVRFLKDANVCHLHFHHIIDYHKDIYKLPETCGLPYDFTLHDFYMFCPNISGYIDEEDYFCGFDPKNDCNCCATKEGNFFYNHYKKDVTLFRKTHGDFLRGARKIIAPSHSTKAFYLRYYPFLKIEVYPHPETYNFRKNKKKDAAATNSQAIDNGNAPKQDAEQKVFNVGLLGGISPKKGRKIFDQCRSLALERELPVRWILIGYTDHSQYREEENFIITGRYHKEELPDLIDQYQIQMMLIPARWPETYSYTLSESFALGIPVMVPKIGALSERVKERGGGIIIESPITADAILNEIEKLIKGIRKLDKISMDAPNSTRKGFDNYFDRVYNSLTFEAAYNSDSSEYSALGEAEKGVIQPDNMRFYERLIRQSVHKTFTHELRRIKKENRLTQNHAVNLDLLYKDKQYKFEKLQGENQLTLNHVINIESLNNALNLQITDMGKTITAMGKTITDMGKTMSAFKRIATNTKQMLKTFFKFPGKDKEREIK